METRDTEGAGIQMNQKTPQSLPPLPGSMIFTPGPGLGITW